MADLMQQARELLAAEFAKDWQRGNCKMIADAILNGDELRGYGIPYALAAIAAALRAAPEWQPIETAPKDDTPVDLWRPVCGGERLANMRRIELSPGNVFYTAIESGYTCVRDATHWMPLPSPPLAARPQEQGNG